MVWRSAVSFSSGVPGRAPAENEFLVHLELERTHSHSYKFDSLIFNIFTTHRHILVTFTLLKVTAGLTESNGSLPPGSLYDYVTCGLTAYDRDQLPTQRSYRVWANFTFYIFTLLNIRLRVHMCLCYTAKTVANFFFQIRIGAWELGPQAAAYIWTSYAYIRMSQSHDCC